MNISKRHSKNRDFSGLKKHTHAERSSVLRQVIVPLLRRELGRNLIAVAADGSYARHEDTDYSDLELMVFVKDKNKLPRGFSKVCDGMLIEGLFITENDYYEMILEPNEQWYLAGSDILLPVLNRAFIEKLKNYRVKNKNRKFAALARGSMHEVQEAFGKLFSAIDARNRENLFVILFDVVITVLKLLAFVNQRPYTSSKRFISEARKFTKKPQGFDEFLDHAIAADYSNWRFLEKYAIKLYRGIEDLIKENYDGGIYDDDISTIYPDDKRKQRR